MPRPEGGAAPGQKFIFSRSCSKMIFRSSKVDSTRETRQKYWELELFACVTMSFKLEFVPGSAIYCERVCMKIPLLPWRGVSRAVQMKKKQ
jgi:hypothetical protein